MDERRAYAYCRELEDGFSRLSVPTPSTSVDEVTLHLASDFSLGALELITFSLVPELPDGLPEGPPQLSFDKWSGCWQSRFNVPKGTTGIAWTLKDVNEGTFITINVTRNREPAVFVHYTLPSSRGEAGAQAFGAWVRSIWSMYAAQPKMLSVVHGQLISGYPSHPPLISVVSTLMDLHARFLQQKDGPLTEDLVCLTLLSFTGQHVITQKGASGSLANLLQDCATDASSSGAGEFLWQIAGRPFDFTGVSRWRVESGNANAAHFALRAVKWLYDFDRNAFISSFRFTALTEVLIALNDGAVESMLGLPVKGHQLRKSDLPDFKGGDAPADAKLVGRAANVPWGDLEQSPTLEEREVRWDKGVKAAQSTLQRLHTAKLILRQERMWLQSRVQEATLAKRSDFRSSWGVLRESLGKAQSILEAVDSSIGGLVEKDLATTAHQLAEKGAVLRRATRDLVASYGKYVGSASDKESYTVATFCGFQKSVPISPGEDAPRQSAAVLPTACVVVPLRQNPTGAPEVEELYNVYFVEQGSGRFRRANGTHVITLHLRDPVPVSMEEGVEVYRPTMQNTMRAPTAIVMMGDEDFLVADSGRAVIRRIHMTEQRGWVIQTVFGAIGQKGAVDGNAQKARFDTLRNMKMMVLKNGKMVILIADGPRLRALVGGSITTGRITTLTSDVSGQKNAVTTEVRDFTLDRDNDVLYFIDRNAIRAIERFSEVCEKGLVPKARIIAGQPLRSGRVAENPVLFHGPQGLEFTRVPRTDTLPERKEDKADDKKDDKKGDKKDDKTKDSKKDDKNKDAKQLERERLKALHEGSVPVLLVSDTMNSCMRAIRAEGWSYVFDKVSVHTVLGRDAGGKAGSSKDGIAQAAMMNNPGKLFSRPKGDFMLCEPGRLRIVAPPQVVERASAQYHQLGVKVEILSDRLVEAAKESNLHSASIVDSVRDARMALLDGRHLVESSAFTDYAVKAIASRPQILTCLLSVAPTAELIVWLSRRAVEEGLINLDLPREATVSSDAVDLPHSRSSLPKVLTPLDAVEEAVARLVWPPNLAEQAAMLKELTKLAEDHPGILGPIATERVLQGAGFRLPPSEVTMKFILATCGVMVADDLTEQMRDAIKTWITAAIPRDSEGEKMTHKKFVRGTLKLWAEFYALERKGDIRDIAGVIAAASLEAGLTTDTHILTFLVWIGFGTSNLLWHEPRAEEIDVLTYEVPSLPSTVVDLIVEVTGRAVASYPAVDVFIGVTDPHRSQQSVQNRLRGAAAAADKKKARDDVSSDDDDYTSITVQDAHIIYCIVKEKLLLQPCVVMTPDGMSLEGLLSESFAELWANVLPWYVKAAKDIHATGAGWQEVSDICKAVGKVFRDGCSRLRDETVTLGIVQMIVAHKEDLAQCFSVVGAKDTDALIQRSETALAELGSLQSSCENAALTFFPDHTLSDYLMKLRNSRSEMTLGQFLAMYNFKRESPVSLPPGFCVLPPRFVRGAKWLEDLRGNAIYHHVWKLVAEQNPELRSPDTAPLPSSDEQADSPDLHPAEVDLRIEKSAAEYVALGGRMQEDTMTFSELQDVSLCMLPEKLGELPPLASGPPRVGSTIHHFCRSYVALKEAAAQAAKGGAAEEFPAPSNRVDTALYTKMIHIFSAFGSLILLRTQRDLLQERIELIGHFVRPTAKVTVQAASTALDGLCKTVGEIDWSQLTIKSFDQIDGYLAGVDESILKTSTDLLKTLQANTAFLDFLSEHASDQNFTSAVEMAMGRPEMECPPELWVCDGDGPGHSDEMVLSKLTGVRTSLHRLLYQPGGLQRGSLTEVTQCLAPLSEAAAAAAVCAIDELAPLQLALADLLSGGGDASALSRLANLYLPAWESEWVFSAAVQSGAVDLCLRYKATRGDKSIECTQKVDELLDFQSAVVLSKGTGEVADIVPKFVAQFGWARDLSQEFTALKKAWHPAKQAFSLCVALATPPDDVKRLVEKATSELRAWEAEVQAVRKRFPLLNTVTLGQLLRLKRAFGGAEACSEAELQGLSAEIAKSMFPSAGLGDARELLQSVWGARAQDTSSGSFLAQVDEMMGIAPTEWQAFGPRPISGNAAASAVAHAKGVQVVVSEKAEKMKALLSAHVRASVLPQWHRVLCVTPATTLELAANLVLSWAHRDPPAGQPELYAIVGIDLLDESIHHAFVSLLVELEPVAKNTLLVISGEMEHYVVRQLAPWRTSSVMLSDEELSHIGVALAGEGERVAVYHSASAGAGKSFAIRCRAGLRRTVHVPMQRNMRPIELIKKIEECVAQVFEAARKDGDAAASAKDSYVLHLDLSESINEESSVLLFELLMLGSLYDSLEGRRWFVDPQVILCVEAAPGTLSLPVLACLDRHVLEANRSTFTFDPDVLRAGMGREFTSRKRDGTGFNTGKTYTPPHIRLQWIVRGLRIVDAGKPLNVAALTQPLAPGDALTQDCFPMLCRVASLQEPVSLWSLWSFVDIAYWLLHSAFTQASQLEEFLGTYGGDNAVQLRSEAFDFICRTAADFATRQKRGYQDDFMWLKVTERTYYEDKSLAGVSSYFYRRSQFRSHGQPVFRMGSFLDPTFIHFMGNRWGMSSDLMEIISEGQEGGGLLNSWKNKGRTMDLEMITNAQMSRENPTLLAKAKDEEYIVDPKEGPLGDLKTWNEANHEALLVSASTGKLAVLAVNHVSLKKRMHPQLLSFLERTPISVGATGVQPHEVLSILTNVVRTEQDAAKLLGGTYCMTRDVLLKILAVFVRVRCGVPVVLMGECGCGKTHMLRYVCAWLGAKLLILDVHGGTTERDILKVFIEAREALKDPAVREVYVFLDEVNTCTHMGLISEIIVDHTIFGVPLKSGIHVLAACNPYRRRMQDTSSAGLAYKAPNRDDLFVDELRDLVYRVHPIPSRIQEFIFDFGSLSESVEESYIQAMVAAHISDTVIRPFVTKLLVRAQQFVREAEGDPSAVSLRDLKRALRLAKWFGKYGTRQVKGRNPWAAPVVLGIVHVFYFRLPKTEQRADLLERLRTANTRVKAQEIGAEFLVEKGAMEKLVMQTMNAICDKLVVDEGIAMNQALKENLYVTMISIFNRIPVFVVGKPGSSKTLTLQVLASNLKGDQSASPFWAKFPALYIFPYQCSPLSTAAGIKHQFDIACSYQKKATKTITVLLLDEVGLAEHSPDMPLKVLHGILVDPPISIVGLSNWTLDAAKMNRAICLQRPEPASNDIHLTGKRILGDDVEGLDGMLHRLSVAYHRVYTTQTGRDFIGMRDYYQTLKLLKRELQHLRAPECVTEGMQCLVVDDDLRTRLRDPAGDSDGNCLLTIGEIVEYIFAEGGSAADDTTAPKVDTTITDAPTAALLTRKDLPEAEHRIQFVEAGLEQMTRVEVEALFRENKLLPFRRLTRTQVQLYAEDAKNVAPVDTEVAIREVRERRKPHSGHGIPPALMSYVLLRNFGGNHQVVESVCEEFGNSCYSNSEAIRKHALPTLRLIASNLSDPASRHLMVLTEHGAALPLLFDSGLMNPDNTEVLVGSTFKDDAHELHLIQQVNKVKAAMATGRPVILHNHDSIYESLYDVLNQRYVTGTVLSSGKEKRMLRLAIGARSQLCPVEEGFRIVVVAEQDHANENLDLPLLNRFEKQSLNFRDCLSEEQQAACSALRGWVEDVVAETTFPNLTHVFSGYNAETIPSLAFSHAEKGIDSLKASLARLAMPVAMLQSQTLCETLPGYTEQQGCLESLLEFVEAQQRSGGDPHNLLTVTTHSPVEQALIRSLAEAEEGDRVYTVVRLAEVTSEDMLKGIASGFLEVAAQEGPEGKPHVLLVQCDPMTSNQAIIEHARRVVQRLVGAAQASLAGCPPVTAAFLVHLPPGAKNCSRVYHVNFYKGWVTCFLDDVAKRESAAEELLHSSLVDLIEGGTIDLMQLASEKLQAALSLVREPTGLAGLFQAKVKKVSGMIRDPEICQVIKSLALTVLRERCGTTSSGLQLHVDLALGNLSAGSLRVSLRYVLDAVVVQVTAHVLRTLDTNCNLMSLSEKTKSLWLQLQKKFHSPEELTSDFAIDGVTRFEDTENTGILQPLACKFPFSFKLLKVHETAKDVLHADAKKGSIDYERMARACETLVGKDTVALWDEVFEKHHMSYLHDFVHSKAAPFPGLSVESTMRLYEVVLSKTDPNVLSSPLAIHVSHWANEERLFFLMSLLSCLSVPGQSTVLESLQGAATSDLVGANAVRTVVEVTVQNLRSAGSNVAAWDDWCQRVYPTIALDSRALVGPSAAIRSLGLVVAFCLEVVLPHAECSTLMQEFFPKLLALKAPYSIAEMHKMFASCTAVADEIKGPFLVTFVREFILRNDKSLIPSADIDAGELCDILRLSCGLRPMVWPGSAPLGPNVRRGLLHALVGSMGMEQLTLLAEEKIKMGAKYTEALAEMLFAYLEDLTPVFSPEHTADITTEDASLVMRQAEPPYKYHNMMAQVRFKKILGWIARQSNEIITQHRDSLQDDPSKSKNLPMHAVKMTLRVRNLLRDFPPAGVCVAKDIANGGTFALMSFLQSGKGLNWFVTFDRNLMEACRHEELLPDIGPVLAESLPQYRDVLTSIETACKGGGPAKERATKVIDDKSISVATRLSAVFSVRVTADRSNSFPGRELIDGWLSRPDLLEGSSWAKSFLHTFGWGPSGRHAAKSTFAWRFAKAVSQNVKQVVYSLMFQMALMLPSMPNCYLHAAAYQPGRLNKCMIPSMPLGGDETRHVLKGMTEYVTWYRCPRGHLYSIGECGGAMEVGRCSHPGCGAAIGGTNHASLKGNVRIGGMQELLASMPKTTPKEQEPGGFYANAEYAVFRSTYTLNPRTSMVLRLALLLSLHLNYTCSDVSLPSLSKKITPSYLHEQMAAIVTALSKQTRLSHGDLLLCLTECYRRLQPLLQATGIPTKEAEASTFEVAAEKIVESVFGKSQAVVAELQQKTGLTSNLSTLKKSLPEELYAVLVGSGEETSKGTPKLLPAAWAPRPVVSIEHFRAYFGSSSSNAARHPLLHAVCENEARLDVIKYLADILELQGLLFEALSGSQLSRDEAAQMPAIEVINTRISDSAKRARASAALTGYCDVFNKAMPLLGNLYECQRNPFLNDKDEVDLSGGGDPNTRVLLSPEAPLTFSLPSMVPGDIDAPGVCTIQLAGLLSRVHNNVMDRLKPQEGDAQPRTISISYVTPPEVVRRSLISYDRERDLLPLLYRHKETSSGYLGYDVVAIERELAMTVLQGKVGVHLQMEHFRYRGELRQRGFLAALSNLDQAAVLPPALEGALSAELTTKQQLKRVLRIIEEIVNYFAAVGANVQPDTPLRTFCTDVMGLSGQSEDEPLPRLLTPAVYEGGQVCHLKALYLYVEGLMEGGALQRVAAKYTGPLQEEQENELRRAAGYMKHSHVTSALRDLLVGPLSAADVNFPGTESLKDYIGYQDMDVGNSDWFDEYFPEDLQLVHAKAAFDLLTKIAQKA